MAIHPCAWNQVVHPTLPYPTECKATWVQHGYFDYVSGMILGRDDVADAIATAEANMESALRFHVAPTWLTGEEHAWPMPKTGSQLSYPPIEADYGHIITGGVEALSLVVADRAIVYQDRDGDGVDDTAVITVTSAEMTAAGATWYELAVYPPADYIDYILYNLDESNRIKPLQIIRNPNTGDVTIWGHRCQFVRPDLWLADDDIRQDLDVNFLSYVNVYRRYTDTSYQAQLVYRGRTEGCESLDVCGEGCQTACLSVDNERSGIVRVAPATFSGSTPTVSSFTYFPPSHARLWYFSGYYKRFNSWIEADWMETRVAKAITLLSLAYLPDAVCGCSQTRELYQRYREEQAIDSLDAAMAQQYFGVVTKGSVFAASTVRLMNPLYGAGNL